MELNTLIDIIQSTAIAVCAAAIWNLSKRH